MIQHKMNNDTTSRLSRGPTNPGHKTYRQNDRRIIKTLIGNMSKRIPSFRVSEICRGAHISAPTFYLHYRSCGDAIRKYENALHIEFSKVILRYRGAKIKRNDKKDAVALLLNIVHKHRAYFIARCRNGDLFLLNKMLDHIRVVLVGTDTNDKTFVTYRGAVVAIIAHWVTKTKADKASVPDYVNYISNVRPTRYGW